jgi:hypothetical protein
LPLLVPASLPNHRPSHTAEDSSVHSLAPSYSLTVVCDVPQHNTLTSTWCGGVQVLVLRHNLPPTASSLLVVSVTHGASDASNGGDGKSRGRFQLGLDAGVGIAVAVAITALVTVVIKRRCSRRSAQFHKLATDKVQSRATGVDACHALIAENTALTVPSPSSCSSLCVLPAWQGAERSRTERGDRAVGHQSRRGHISGERQYDRVLLCAADAA